MRILILFILLVLPARMLAQHNHFIYIQGENQQVFYIKKGAEVISSSGSGFLILPKLQPGTHQFTIGFPKDQFPEHEFQVEISGKDRGFTLKNYTDKGWGLMDMQSLEVIMGKKIAPKKEVPPSYGAMSDDPFAMILASVVNDPGIRETSLVQSAVWVSAPMQKPIDKNEKSVALKENKKAEPKKVPEEVKPAPPAVTETVVAQTPPRVAEKDPPVVHTETPKTKGNEPVTVVPEKKAEVKTTEPPVSNTKITESKLPEPASLVKSAEKYVAQKIVKISELKTWTGYQLMYVDHSAGKPDTIQVIIDDGVAETAPAKSEPTLLNAAKMPRTDCKVMAREKDVLNLRKKMLTIANEQEMVEMAMKDLRGKCFTVEQLQNLSYVFVTDQGRLSLFEQAYPYIFDPANYHRLERLLNSGEYIDRFKLLIK